MQKYLPTAVIALAALVIGASGMRTVQSATTVAVPPEISVTADGTAYGVPDTARVWIGVEVFGPTLAPADREADQRISAVIASLRGAGIPDAHMRTAAVTVAPQYDTQNGQPQQLTGYISRSMLEIETGDLQGLPALIDGAMSAGANRVDQVVYQVKDLDSLRAQARDQAWQAASARANQLASRAGTRLDRVVQADEPVVEQNSDINANQTPDYSSGLGARQSSMQAGEIEVHTRLHVVWSTQ